MWQCIYIGCTSSLIARDVSFACGSRMRTLIIDLILHNTTAVLTGAVLTCCSVAPIPKYCMEQTPRGLIVQPGLDGGTVWCVCCTGYHCLCCIIVAYRSVADGEVVMVIVTAVMKADAPQ